MCDTVCAVDDQHVLFGKNSDREAGEAQVVEVHQARTGLAGTVRCTHVSVPQTARTHAVLLSRPAWMWGCEMGANDAGVVAGNEAVFTRFPIERTGLTGMDAMRLALERASSSRECIDVVAEAFARVPQGGAMSFRGSLQYHSSFLFADRTEAWVMETAGPFWAAEKVRGVRTISNALSIGVPDLVHAGAADEAWRRGWLRPHDDFDFARCFRDPFYSTASGGAMRRACTTRGLGDAPTADVSRVKATLRDHGGKRPAQGVIMGVPCAHASWMPTRTAGQTTGSMVSQLDEHGAKHWLTGTSSPCVSVYKPVSLEIATDALGPPAPVRPDRESLYWRHERLHRAVLRGYDARRATFESERLALEDRFAAETSPDSIREAWSAHREATVSWLALAERAPAQRRDWAFHAWWSAQSRRDGIEARE